METEHSQNFNERLSQWVANQGFWFQLRYSMTGSGTKGTALFHLLKLGFRLLLFLIVVAAAGGIYLIRRTGTEKFSVGLKDSLQAGLTATETEVKGFSRVQGELGINRVSFEGGNSTFFTSLVARNVRCKMGFLDGVAGNWDPGTVTISRLDIDLRAGADDEESAAMLAKALFRKPKDVDLKSLEIADATLRWGYSERTRGSIENSLLKVQRQENGYKLNFRGGTFSQNWLRKLEIINLVVSCDPEGLVFEKAELRRGQGTVDFSGLRLVGGERPTVSGLAKIKRLGMDVVLPLALRSFVEGSISGDFKVTGSTNTAEGIGFEGLITLDGQDTITVRDRVHLLKALSTVDYVRNYHRVDFREGSFRVKTTGGGMEVTDLTLKADDLLTLDGKLRVRLPTPEETSAALEKGSVSGGTPIFNGEDAESDEQQRTANDNDFTLRRAAIESRRIKEGGTSDASSLFERLGLTAQMRQLAEQASERSSRTLRYEGLVRISVPPDAFERAPQLSLQFPVDAQTGRIPLMVPLEGSLYELTLKQAEDVYQQGRR